MSSVRLVVAYFAVAIFCVEAFPSPVGVVSHNNHLSTSLFSSKQINEPLSDRRSVLSASAAALLSLLLGDSAKAAEPQNILITGCNSGIGFEAAKILAEGGHTLILACRTLEKAKDAAKRIASDTTAGTLIPAECNLASLESINSFVRDMKIDKLDVVCLNAGVSLSVDDKQVQRTAEGFELTGT
jgi:hypothetical protein